MERARIHVHRDSDGSAERFRTYKILLDGVRVGSVKRGRTTSLETEAGPHSLQVAIDWGRSLPIELDLGPGEEVDVQCWVNAKPLSALYWITLGRRRYLGLRVSSSTPSAGQRP